MDFEDEDTGVDHLGEGLLQHVVRTLKPKRVVTLLDARVNGVKRASRVTVPSHEPTCPCHACLEALTRGIL